MVMRILYLTAGACLTLAPWAAATAAPTQAELDEAHAIIEQSLVASCESDWQHGKTGNYVSITECVADRLHAVNKMHRVQTAGTTPAPAPHVRVAAAKPKPAPTAPAAPPVHVASAAPHTASPTPPTAAPAVHVASATPRHAAPPAATPFPTPHIASLGATTHPSTHPAIASVQASADPQAQAQCSDILAHDRFRYLTMRECLADHAKPAAVPVRSATSAPPPAPAPLHAAYATPVSTAPKLNMAEAALAHCNHELAFDDRFGYGTMEDCVADQMRIMRKQQAESAVAAVRPAALRTASSAATPLAIAASRP